ncbi:MAG: hypothetical protein AAF532_03515 [Planctomycetota bacterium]
MFLGAAAKLRFEPFVVRRAVRTGSHRMFARAGGFGITVARRSLKPARQKRLGELTPDERRRYDIRAAEAKRKGKPKPRRPEVTSRPGEPPKLHQRPSPLKRRIRFAVDRRRDSLVIGFLPYREAEAPARLEHGEDGYAARPTMKPALAAVMPRLREFSERN